MGSIITTGDIMVAERVIYLAIVDEVDTASHWTNLVDVLPSCLLLENVSVRVLQINRLFRFLRRPAKEAWVQIQNCLPALII